MKQYWEEKTLGDVLDVLRNGANCKQDKKGVGDKISRIESISNADFDINKVGYATLSKSDKDKHRLLKGDILFSHINSPIHVGKTALFNSDEEVYHGVNLLLMRTKSFLNESYFEHYLKFLFKEGYWKGLCKQSVNQASVNQNDIKKVTINFPKSLPQQKQIVSILDKAFAAIDRAKANAEQNLQNAKELFESYLQNIFENKGDDWEEKTIGDIGKPSMCKRILKEQTTTDGDIPFYKIGTFGKAPNAYISKELYEEYKSKYSFPKKGDILISASGTIGRRVIYNGEPGFFQDSNIVWIDNNEKQVLNEYLYSFYGYCDWQPSKGATISRLYNANLKRIKITFPKSLQEQKKVIKKIEVLSNKTKKLEAIYKQKIADLEEMKKSVLQKAFSGQLNTIN
ncbi:restriction endonuclease subunit S [Flavobacteriales bacterium]|nr:restriction endonuclease subunit S [Flavobacteriales bacterium]